VSPLLLDLALTEWVNAPVQGTDADGLKLA
jgi:hypothetical protein